MYKCIATVILVKNRDTDLMQRFVNCEVVVYPCVEEYCYMFVKLYRVYNGGAVSHSDTGYHRRLFTVVLYMLYGYFLHSGRS